MSKEPAAKETPGTNEERLRELGALFPEAFSQLKTI